VRKPSILATSRLPRDIDLLQELALARRGGLAKPPQETTRRVAADLADLAQRTGDVNHVAGSEMATVRESI
jgi:hypothetical protein